VSAQNKKKRLQPGKLYGAGETIYAPRYGFTSIIPDRWKGTLPRDMEIFLLLPDTTSIGGEIYTFASEKNNIESLQKHWMQGMNFSESIKIKATQVDLQNDMISSELVPDGQSVNTANKGFAAARCSEFGYCITCLAIGPSQFYEDMKVAVKYFIVKASFTQPSNISMYVDFSWKEFLSDKMLITLAGMDGSQSGSKENIFHMCSDGSFTGKIKKTGLMKEFDSKYKGKQSGTWSTESIGEAGILKLTFKKLPPVELNVSIKDDKILIAGERYFAADSDKCKK
jgi:hypothetical protein